MKVAISLVTSPPAPYMLGALLLVSTVGYAQQTGGQEPVAAESVIEEIVVTARKREESLQEVPLSISAFNAEMIERRGLENVFDVAKFTPNLSFNQSFGRMFDRPVIRGMSQILGDRTVAFVVDGIYIAGDISGADLDDLEAVEVLKGPQAAAFGRGSLAGVISYRTQRPSAEWAGQASLTRGDDDYVEATARISGPIVDRLSFKLSGRYYDYGGQYEGSTNDGGTYRFGSEQTKRVSGALRWEPTEDLDISLRAFASENADGLYANNLFTGLNCFVSSDLSGRRGSYCGVVPTIPSSGAGLQADLRDAQRQGPPGVEVDINLYSLEANWNAGPVAVTGLVGWSRQDDDYIIDDYVINLPGSALQSQIPGPTMTNSMPGGIARLITVREYRSQELRFASTGVDRLQWLFGLYHYDEAREGYSGFPTYNVLVMGVPASANNGVVGSLRSFSTPVSPFEVENDAVFGSVEYAFGERWHASLEGRYARDVLTTNNSVQAIVGSNPLGRGTYCAAALESEYESFSPRGTLRFAVSESANLYASVSQGNKPGGFNTTLCSTNFSLAEAQRLAGIAPLGVEEEEALNYEVGAKLRFLGGRLSLDASVFFIDWTNQQVTLSQVGTSALTGLPISASLILNAGETSIKGAELSLRYRLNEIWNVSFDWGHSDATFDQFCDATYAQITGQTTQVGECAGAANVPTRSVAGFQTANAPKNTGTAGVEMRLPVSDQWHLFARADATYQSERFAEVYNHASTGDMLRFGARVGVESERWRVFLWGRNIGNERAVDGITRAFHPDTLSRAWQVHYPNGRQLGVTASFGF